MLLLSSILIIYVTYVKSALTRGLAAHDCGGPEKALYPPLIMALTHHEKKLFFKQAVLETLNHFCATVFTFNTFYIFKSLLNGFRNPWIFVSVDYVHCIQACIAYRLDCADH